MESITTTIISGLLLILVGMLVVLTLVILAVLQKVHEEALKTNGRLRELERTDLLREGGAVERAKHASGDERS